MSWFKGTRAGVVLGCACAASVYAFAATKAAAAEEHPRPRVRAVRVESPPTIDGRLNEPAWQHAGKAVGFRQREPVELGEPTQKTEAFVLYDSEALYVGLYAFDTEPEKIRATHMSRDDQGTRFDDAVGITLDVPRDERSGYSFIVNAAGTRLDALIENSEFIFDWDGVWNAKTRQNEDGWSCEIVIPFRSLNVDPAKTTWGLEFLRAIPRTGELINWARPLQSYRRGSLQGLGFLDGMEGVEQGLGLDVTLNLAARYSDDAERTSFSSDVAGTGTVLDKGRSSSDFDPGVDLFYRVTPSLSASLTTNTDFGEAEVDSRQINNSRFDLFFPEKRRFFLKDFGIFDFSDLVPSRDADRTNLTDNGRPFFSRRIGLARQSQILSDGQPRTEAVPVNIRAGFKLSGRVGPINVGLLTAQTDRAHVRDEVFSNDGRVTRVAREIDDARLTMARATLNILEQSNIGMIYTAGDPDRDRTRRGLSESHLIGFDLNLRSNRWIPGRTLESNFWVQRSMNPRELFLAREIITGDVSSGAREWAWGGRVYYPNDKYNWELGYRRLGGRFRPALGFVNQPGISRYDGRFRYRHRPEGKGVIRNIDNEVLFIWNQALEDGKLLDGKVVVRPFRLETRTQDKFEVALTHDLMRAPFPFRVTGLNVLPGRFTNKRISVRLVTADYRKFALDLQYRYGGFFEKGGWSIVPAITWRPNRHFNVKVSYQEFTIDSGFDVPVHPGLLTLVPALLAAPDLTDCSDVNVAPFCTGDDVTLRLVSTRVEYNFSPDLSLKTLIQFDSESNNLSFNSRLQWIVEPGREIFLVLNQGLIWDDRRNELHRGLTEPRLKLSWLYRF